jgi:type VI secretion system protein ImpA
MADLTSFDPPPPVDGWLQALSADAPCGPDLEYDPENLELQKSAAGKPETQFAAAEPPQWPLVLEQAAALMERTRDLRIALLWCRAKVNVSGFPAVPAVLSLLHGLMESHWDALHPLPDPDDGDTFARLSVLGSLDKTDGLLGDIRQALIQPTDRRLGGLRIRDIEIATDRLAPRPDENPRTAGQIAGLMADLPDAAELLRRHNAEARFCLQRLQRLMGERFSLDMGVDLKSLKGMLQAVETVLPQGEPEALADPEDAGEAIPVPGSGSDDRCSSQKIHCGRNRMGSAHCAQPRVQIEYDVELYGAEKKVQLPFVMGVMADLPASRPTRCRRWPTASSWSSTSTTSIPA